MYSATYCGLHSHARKLLEIRHADGFIWLYARLLDHGINYGLVVGITRIKDVLTAVAHHFLSGTFAGLLTHGVDTAHAARLLQEKLFILRLRRLNHAELVHSILHLTFTIGMERGIHTLEAANVRAVSLTDIDTITAVAVEDGCISEADAKRVLAFRDNPIDESWRQA